MLENVPQRYISLVESWRNALEMQGSEGQKILWNFDNEPRVLDVVRNRFLDNLSDEYGAVTGVNPIDIIPDCVEEDMLMQGPEPEGELPERFARVRKLELLNLQAVEAGIGRPSSGKPKPGKAQRSNKRVNDRILEELSDHIIRKSGFLWVTDAHDLEDLYRREGPDEVRNHLGLNEFFEGDEIIVMTFTEESVRRSNLDEDGHLFAIPTVMEGQTNQAFTPDTGGSENSGFTTDLSSGYSSLPEWVCRGVDKDLGVELLNFPDNMITLRTQPPEVYLGRPDNWGSRRGN